MKGFLAGVLILILTAEVNAQQQDSIAQQISQLLNRIAKRNDIQLQLQLGRLYVRTENYDAVVKLYKSRFKKNECTSDELKLYGIARLRIYEDLPLPGKHADKLFGDNLRHARMALLKAAAMDTTDLEARFFMGVYLRAAGKNDEALRIFHYVFERDYRFQTYVYGTLLSELTSLLTQQRQFKELAELHEKMLSSEPRNATLKLQLALSYMEMNEEAKAADLFYQALDSLTDSTEVDRLFEDCEVIAAENETQAFQALRSVPEKVNYVRAFWKRRNANLFDDVHTALIEYYRRCHYAKVMYPSRKKPYFDDRGLIYVRFGRPDRIYTGFLEDLNVRENETWIYDRIGGGLHFDFVLMTKGYELRPLGDAVIMGNGVLYGLYAERQNLNPYYSNMLFKIENRRLSIWNLESDYLYREDYEAVAKLAHDSFFIYSDPVDPIYFNSRYATFRESDNLTRMDMYYVVPYSQMKFFKGKGNSKKMESDLSLTMKIFDYRNYNEVVTLKRQKELFADRTEIEKYSVVDEFRYVLKPDTYLVAIQIDNNEKQKLNLYQYKVTISSYDGDTIRVSDIQLAVYGNTTDERFIKPHTHINVIPNAAARSVKSSLLPVYFEIYNLKLNADGKSSYAVTYTVKSSEESKTFFHWLGHLFSKKTLSEISFSTTKAGSAVTQGEYLTLDISDLPDGMAYLEVTVKDLNTQKENRSRINLILADK